MPKILISTLHPIRQRPAGPYLCLSFQTLKHIFQKNAIEFEQRDTSNE